MSDTLLAAIVGAVAGIITGSIGSLFAPWANYGVEKRKQRLAHRRELVAKWRIMLSRLINDPEPGVILGRALLQETDYMSLKPHLSTFIIERIKSATRSTERVGGPISTDIYRHLIEEVNKIEKKWKLV